MDDLRSLCRTCGKIINEELDIKLFEELNYPLLTLIEDIADMWLEYDICLPEYICIDCKSLLDKITDFRECCLNTHKKLLAARKDDIKNKYNAENLGQTENSTDFVNIEIIDTNNSQLENIDGEFQKTRSTKQCDSKIRERRKYPVADKHCLKNEKIDSTNAIKKRQNNAKTWICELCGGQFKCSTYLKLHMLRHTGKKEFECDICKGRYYTQNEMLRHKILHTSAKPYACRYCDKSFRGTSSKAVHERTHTNERPFACQFCDKAFRSTSVRKMHERVHVNNRKFHCEPCDQWFLRSSHLNLHQRTKLHKSKIVDK